MKHYKLRKLQTHRHFVHDRYLIGIDPAKACHQAQLLSPEKLGLLVSTSAKLRPQTGTRRTGLSRTLKDPHARLTDGKNVLAVLPDTVCGMTEASMTRSR